MRRLCVGNIFAVATLAMSGMPAQAQSMKDLSWNGAWQSNKGFKPAIEIQIKDGKLNQLMVDGSPREITSIEVSPDQKTVLFAWETGQGTLLRVEEKAAEVSLFGQKMNVRNAVVARK